MPATKSRAEVDAASSHPKNPLPLVASGLNDREGKIHVIGRNVDLATENSLHPLIKTDVKRELKIIYER